MGLWIALMVLLAIIDPGTLYVLGQVFGLSFAVGREAAMLFAYTQRPSMGPGWILMMAVLDDLVTLGLTLPLAWIGLERFRGVHLVGGVVLSLEKAAVEKRGFLRRWGVWGLIAFVWFPGIGAGVFLAAAMGVIAKIPLRRLILALALGSIAVNAFWAIGLYFTSSLIPAAGIWSYIPLALVGILGLVAVAFGWLERRRRNLFPIVKIQIMTPAHLARLLDVGITDGNHLLYVNRRTLAARLGIDPALLGRLRSVAELSMLQTVTPQQAETLTEVGITSIRDLAVAPPELVSRALRELQGQRSGADSPRQAEIRLQASAPWSQDARNFLAESVT